MYSLSGVEDSAVAIEVGEAVECMAVAAEKVVEVEWAMAVNAAVDIGAVEVGKQEGLTAAL